MKCLYSVIKTKTVCLFTLSPLFKDSSQNFIEQLLKRNSNLNKSPQYIPRIYDTITKG